MSTNPLQCDFESLLAKYQVIVPEIQRDYVQGKPSVKKNIAKPFVTDLLGVLLSPGKTLTLDFIYGATQEDSVTQKTTLFLLDGQQRLTTLFLLYYYLCLMTHNTVQAKSLYNFSYQTRLASRDFCHLLIENLPQTSQIVKQIFRNNSEEELGKIIQESFWFFSRWKEDPSVANMLSMLTVIHAMAKDMLSKELAEPNCLERLLGKSLNRFKNIQFNFLELSQVDLSTRDAYELYLKMNRRRKYLTAFEIFKSRLSNLLSDVEKKKLDGEWYDYFWKLDCNADSFQPKEVDNKLCRFFENITWFWVMDSKSGKEILSEPISLLDRELYDEQNGIYFKDSPYIKTLTSVLEKLPELHPNSLEYQAFINFLKSAKDSSETSITYHERLLFYCLVLYFNQPLFCLSRHSWFRICANLIQNTRYDKLEDVWNSMWALKNLNSKLASFSSPLSERTKRELLNEIESLSSFDKSQAEEEAIKLKLVLEQKISEAELSVMEKHPYFNGKISFLLNFAYDLQTGSYNISQLKRYYEVAKYLFTKEFFLLFQKALLCMGDNKGNDYLMPIGSRWSFGNLNASIRDRQDTWHKVFNNEEKRYLLKALCDVVLSNVQAQEITPDAIREQLNCVVEKQLKENNSYSDWRYWFLKEDQLLQKQEIRCKAERQNISLKGGYGQWSRKYELYTYAFSIYCTKYQEMSKWDTYHVKEGNGVRGPYLPKTIKLNDKQQSSVCLNLFYLEEKNGFVVFAFINLSDDWENKTTSNIADILEGKVYEKCLGKPDFSELAKQISNIERNIKQLTTGLRHWN